MVLLLATAVTTPGPAQAGPASDPGPDRADRAGRPAVAARVPVLSAALVYASALEPYARYQPPRRCRPRSRPGVLLLAEVLVARGGGQGPIGRSCSGAASSEHHEARAFDWMLDVRDPAQEALATQFLAEVLAPDHLGNPHALARRMGIMYVIWDDTIWSAYHGFVPRPYLSSSCRTRRRCSPTLRHRDHVHVSLTRRAARGLTSWYLEQPALPVQTFPPDATPTP
ncbi:hypothetical protein [Nocardioides solisilvae]|uniref:hypothetical protein n=1 Tax=Nocardioides solisilvae TaxID=1542435 RepID=UPI000D740733|nr:hypothetical protein [Nocardioides solisilvae]